MNIPSSTNQISTVPSATTSAREGLRAQDKIFERNVVEVAQPGNSNAHDIDSRDKALVEQKEIVQAVQANARSLEAGNESVGTLIDLKV